MASVQPPRVSLPLLDQFGDQRIAASFSRESYLRACLDAEAALALAEADVGLIPEAAAAAIAEAAARLRVDIDRLDADGRVVGYPVLPLVRQLSEATAPAGAGYVHWGATTQDIMDTAMAIVMREGVLRLQELSFGLCETLARLTESHAYSAMPGRTHGQQAVPITFGQKTGIWLDEFVRHELRLAAASDRAIQAQLAGAAGTLATLREHAPAVRSRFASRLGLPEPSGPWHTARDGLGELVAVLGLVAASCGKVAREIIDLARTEIGEVAEANGHLRGASSTMPQKRNPIGSEVVVGFSLLSRAIGTTMGNAQPGHERASGEWQAEWDAIPLVFATTAGAILGLQDLLSELRVDVTRMRANLQLDGGLIMAEAVMISLAESIGRERAHDLVYEIAQRAHEGQISFADALAADQRVADDCPEGRCPRRPRPRRLSGRGALECAGSGRALARANVRRRRRHRSRVSRGGSRHVSTSLAPHGDRTSLSAGSRARIRVLARRLRNCLDRPRVRVEDLAGGSQDVAPALGGCLKAAQGLIPCLGRSKRHQESFVEPSVQRHPVTDAALDFCEVEITRKIPSGSGSRVPLLRTRPCPRESPYRARNCGS